MTRKMPKEKDTLSQTSQKQSATVTARAENMLRRLRSSLKAVKIAKANSRLETTPGFYLRLLFQSP